MYCNWDTRISSQSRIFGYVTGFIRDVSDWFQGKYSGARVWIDQQFDANGGVSPYSRNSSLVMAQNILGDTTDHVWTVVAAPNSGVLGQAVACLVDPRVWRQIAGKIAVLNADDGAVTAIASNDARLIPTQPLSVWNVRLIVAGWFSLNGRVYVMSALALALLLAASTHWFLRNVGRKAE